MSYTFSVQCNRCDTMIELDKLTKSFTSKDNMIRLVPLSTPTARILSLKCDCGNEIRLMEEFDESHK